MTMPDIIADTWLGAAACAGGSQKCIGTNPALNPNPTSASNSTDAIAPADSVGDTAARESNDQSFADTPHVANIAKSANVAVCVATMYMRPALLVSASSWCVTISRYE